MEKLLSFGNNSEEFVDITPDERAKQLKELEEKLNEMELEINEEERQLRIQQKESGALNENERKCSYKCFSTSDIKTEIAGRFQRSVYNMYYLWIFNSLTLIMNWISMFIYNNTSAPNTGSHFMMTTLFVLIGIPGIFS